MTLPARAGSKDRRRSGAIISGRHGNKYTGGDGLIDFGPQNRICSRERQADIGHDDIVGLGIRRQPVQSCSQYRRIRVAGVIEHFEPGPIAPGSNAASRL